MKITQAKIKRELEEKYGYNVDKPLTSKECQLINDIISIIDEELKYHKGISVK